LRADGFADRFEIYWHGMELTNGCAELTQASELRVRWEMQNTLRKQRGVKPHPFPERLHAALESGLPDCAGVAIGLERLALSLARQQGHQGKRLL